jgi:hypothetical protein
MGNYRVSSFHLTRSAKLILALQTSFCDACDLLAIALECTGALGAAVRGAMIAYMPNGGMYAPPGVPSVFDSLEVKVLHPIPPCGMKG